MAIRKSHAAGSRAPFGARALEENAHFGALDIGSPRSAFGPVTPYLASPCNALKIARTEMRMASARVISALTSGGSFAMAASWRATDFAFLAGRARTSQAAPSITTTRSSRPSSAPAAVVFPSSSSHIAPSPVASQRGLRPMIRAMKVKLSKRAADFANAVSVAPDERVEEIGFA